MALDREKAFANAERLLKQGRVSLALDEYRRIAEEAPRDVLTQNRIGDSLARAGRTEEAIAYYDRAGEHFAQAGFYSRAVAILKKIVKLSPGRTDVVVRLADLYVRQNLSGEARPYYLQAADAYLKARQFGKTREVYERLVEVDPSDLVNRVRLAEARAAEGDAARGGEDLLAIAGSMLAAGRGDDAERTYRRASELLPDRVEPVAGMARCLARSGRGDEAIAAIEAAAARRPADPHMAGEKLILLEALAREEDEARFLAGPQAVSLRDEDILRAFAEARARGSQDGFLDRLDPAFAAWRGAGRGDRVEQLLDRLSLAVEGGWPAALERILALRTAAGALPRTLTRVLERTIAAHDAHGNRSRVAELRERLAAALAASGPSGPGAVPENDATPEAPGAPLAAGAPGSAESPAVPLTPQDHEAVSGHITEAEVFLKYGLQNEAHDQLRELVRRFPGHVPAVQRFVEFLRVRPDRDELRDALVTLALARRSAGDHAGARQAASEACVGALPPDAIETLSRLGLWLPPENAPPAGPAPAARHESPLPPVVPAGPAPSRRAPAAAAAPAPASESSGDIELVVDFDGADASADPTPPAPRPSGPKVRVVSPDMVEEIAFYVEQGMGDDALKKIAALRILGFGGPDLDALERRAGDTPVADLAAEIVVESDEESAFEIDEKALDDVVGQARLDDVDLTAITEGFQVESGADLAAAPPAPEAEQSLEEVFDEFKRQVSEEVGSDDFRTHYDLGIAYKEMGLLDDALAAFVAAAQAPELFREACSMMALCHRERGELDEAARCYREAIAAAGGEGEPSSGVRYELAELLVERGDLKGALDLFQEILSADPSYRDVRARIAAMESGR